MSDAAAPAAPAAGGKKKFKLVLLVLPLVAAGAGAAVPLVVDVPALMGTKKEDPDAAKKKKHAHDEHLAEVPVGNVVANLFEERMTRHVRVTVAVQCELSAEAKVKEHVEKHKAALKSWMIGYLSGKTLKEVTGTVAINRLQREFFERFEDILYPTGESPLRAVLFEEYVVQ